MKRLIPSLFAILILSTSALYADIGPGPSPSLRENFGPDVPEGANPAATDSTTHADVAPIPVPEAKSPVPLVIAGLAATAGVALVGLYLAKRGRSGNTQDQ